MPVSGGGLNEGSSDATAASVTVWVAVGGKVVVVDTDVLRILVVSCWIVAVGDSSPQIMD